MAATAAAYNRLHNGGFSGSNIANAQHMAIGGNSCSTSGCGVGGMGHSQLARSLERILEEAHFSGELILTNRKLKDFPKTGTKFNLTDTVIADLSRNRFCELPEEITSFAFLETLLLYHNTIRSIPESVKQLTSLTYLDLRSNQLSTLPREICFLPLQVLLVSNNRLATLPDELGRMDRLTDLDVSYNQLTALPARIGELSSLRSFSLRSNQLMYLPRELTCLNLVALDVSNNRIASLPLEIRQMTTLVEFNLENNPLTSPPASLCVRGLVHVFKFLETQATKDEKGSRAGGNYDGYTTLRRAPRHNSAGNMLETAGTTAATMTTPRTRHHIDSGYGDGFDKRWSHDMPVMMGKPSASVSTSKLNDSPIRRPMPTMATHSLSAELMDASVTSSTSTIVDESLTLSGSGGTPPPPPPALVKSLHHMHESSLTSSPAASPIKHINYAHSISSSNGSSPDHDDDHLMIDHNERNVHCNGVGGTVGKVGDEKLNKSLSNIQTYKEYKEALKQQRNQEITNIYKQKHGPGGGGNANLSPNETIGGGDEQMLQRLNGVSMVPQPKLPKSIMKHTNHSYNNGTSNVATNGNSNSNSDDAILVIPKKPIQKVIPSRNTELMTSMQQVTGKMNGIADNNGGSCLGYVKPNSPMKLANGACGGGGGAGILSSNNNKMNGGAASSGGIKSPVGSGASTKLGIAKTHRTVTWNHEIPSEKLSFTMRREFDRQREETELMTQLRSIIETRLKMSLPEDIASALTDGVILCHLANYVRPRSVASIHVPSPGVSKLTMARCRRNVDNFLEACRRIGVDEELICSCADVVPQITDDDEQEDQNDVNDYLNKNKQMKKKRFLPKPIAVLRTVVALIALDSNPLHQNIRYLQQQQELQQKLQQHQQQQQQQQQQNDDEEQSKDEESLQPNKQVETNSYKYHNFGQEQLTEPTCTKQQQQMQSKQHQEQHEHEQDKNYEIVTKMEFENSLENFHTKTYVENIITTKTTNHHHHVPSTADNVDNKKRFDDYDKTTTNDTGAATTTTSTTTTSTTKTKTPNKETKESKNTVTQFIRTAKLKTFQKIKLNLLTSHGHHSFGNTNYNNNNNNNNNDQSSSSSSSASSSASALASSSTMTTTLHTIVESEHDVVPSGPTGHYQLINEKTIEGELPSYVGNVKSSLFKKSTTDVKVVEKEDEEGHNNKAQEQLTLDQQHYSMDTKDGAMVSKRIEFFEHNKLMDAGTGAAATTTTTTSSASKVTTKSGGIFSIYRINGLNNEESGGVKSIDQAQVCAMMLKSKDKEQQQQQEAGSSSMLLKHDSHTLTIILSCVFIVTFLLLVFFPIPG